MRPWRRLTQDRGGIKLEGEEGLSRRLSDKAIGGEVDSETKTDTSWSHSYLNQKLGTPLFYPK